MTSPLYLRFREALELRGFAVTTIDGYVRIVRRFAEHHLRGPDQMTDEELRDYLLHLIHERKLKRGTMIGIVSALRAFYRMVLHRSTESISDVLPCPKVERKVPEFYSASEIEKLLCLEGLPVKQRTMLITAYATGMRASEVCRLKVEHILSSVMRIRVVGGKGQKDRYTVLSPKLLNILRNYWRLYRPATWLFPSPVNPEKPLCAHSLQRTLRIAVKRSGLPYRGGVHSLRHSFATHAFEAGVGLPTLQNLLGHARLSSTMVYLHVSESRLEEAKSPLDLINISSEIGTSRDEAGKQIR